MSSFQLWVLVLGFTVSGGAGELPGSREQRAQEQAGCGRCDAAKTQTFNVNATNKPEEVGLFVTSDPFSLPCGVGPLCPWVEFCTDPMAIS